jgi:UPF0042 nucleotide-binding protein
MSPLASPVIVFNNRPLSPSQQSEATLYAIFFGAGNEAILNITLYSFGFKHGYPQADLVWDVRFLPNPHWVPELKSHTGQEPQVANYVLKNETGVQFLALLEPLLGFLFDEYAARDRETVTLAVGCTGGRHRSVALVEHLRVLLEGKGLAPQVYHRDIDKE